MNRGEDPRRAGLSDLLPLEAISIGAEAADWRDAVRRAGDALLRSGVTTSSYTDEMIAAVEAFGPYIVIAPGIALAHSRPSPSVLRSGMSLVTLRTPVEFGNAANDPVRLVIGLAAPDEEGHVDALATLANYLVDDERREALLAAGDAQTIRGLIADYELSGETAGAA